MNNKRLYYIDILKGFAIFLMVMAHILLAIKGSSDQTVARFIYTFHMPLFMFMSGYVFDLNRKVEMDKAYFLKLIKKRFLTLIVPGTVWMLIGYVFMDDTFTFPWFLRTLFEIIIVVYIMLWLCNKLQCNMIGTVIALVILYAFLFFIKHMIDGAPIDEILNMSRLQIFYPYFAFGYLFRRYEWEKILQRFHVFSISIVLFLCGLCMYDMYILGHGVQACIKYVTAASGIVICYNIARSVNTNNIFIRLFKYIGFYSLNIYLLSPFFQPCPQWIGNIIQESTISGEVFHKTSVFAQIAVGTILTTYTVIVCMAITKIIEKSRIINKILFGR